MFEKILKELKTKYADKGLSEAVLKVKAKQIEKAVKTEEEIENAVAGVEEDMVIFQSLADQNRTLANEFRKFKEEKGGNPEPNPNPNPEPPKPNPSPTGDEIPAWAKGFTESIKTLTDNLNAYKAKETAQTNAEKFQAKLKELKVSENYLKTLPSYERNFQSDEEIEAVANEYKSKSDVFEQLAANSALANTPKPLFGEAAKEGELTASEQAYLDSKKS